MAKPASSTLPGTSQSPAQPNDASGNHLIGFSPRFWVLVVLTGIGTGIGAGLLMWLLRAVQHLCYSYQGGTFLDGVRQVPVMRRAVVVIIAGFVASAGVWALKRSSGGHGGELNERIWFHSGRMPAIKTILQAAFSMVLVAMGASLGRESAPKQTGAAIASFLSRLGKLTSAESRLLAACGAGAGMGAVYNVPLGGALFALEVLLGTLALPLIPVALAVSFIATAVSWLFLPNKPTYIVPSYPVDLAQIIWSIGFGPIAGLASVAFVRLIIMADGFKPKKGIAMTAPIIVFTALAVLSIRFPQLLGNGKDPAQLGFVGSIGLPMLIALTFLKPVATAACMGSGAPGGLFTPSVMFGAMLGGSLGRIWSFIWAGIIPGAASGSYALIGAAAVLAASMQAPIAAIVLVLELTHHVVTMMVPIMFAVAGASVTARRVDPRSVYSGRVHTGRMAAEAEPPSYCPHYQHLLAPETETISVAANYPEVLERFVTEASQDRQMPKPLYVIDEKARLTGRIDAWDAGHPGALPPVLSTAAAGDLMERIVPLQADATEAEALARLRDEPSGELPVVTQDGRLVGVAMRPQ
jgi:CIC family chloride channel protein